MNNNDRQNLETFLRNNIDDDEVYENVRVVMLAFVDQGWCDGFDFANQHADRLPVPVAPLRSRIKADGTR